MKAFAASLRARVGDADGMRPLLCNGNPLTCTVAVVGANPGTSTRFWESWSDERGMDLQGVIELLSKRERIHLRVEDGQTIRILFPKRLLGSVSELHLDQRVRLRRAVTDTENPITGEGSIFHELLDIIG